MGIKPHIELSIDELILEGFPAHARYRIADAMENELTRLLTESEWAPEARTVERLEPLSIRLTPGGGWRDTGVEVARTLFQALRRERKNE